MNYLDIQYRTSPDLFQQSVSFRLYEKKDGKYKFIIHELVLGSTTNFKGILCMNNEVVESYLLRLNLENVVQSLIDKMNLFSYMVQFKNIEFRTSFCRIANELMFELKREMNFEYLLQFIAKMYHDDFLVLRTHIEFFKQEKFNVIRLLDSILESFYIYHVNKA